MMKITTTMIHPETGDIMYETENVKTVVLDNKHVGYEDNEGYHVACFNKQIMNVHFNSYTILGEHPQVEYLICACKTEMKYKR